MATKANHPRARMSAATAEQLRNEINQCCSMLKQVEEMLDRHRGALLRR